MPTATHNLNKMEKRTRSYVNEAVRQIMGKPLVKDLIVLNKYGNPVETTMDINEALEVTGLIKALRVKIESAIEILDPKNELVMIRLRSKKNETIFAPDGNISVIVIQDLKDCFIK